MLPYFFSYLEMHARGEKMSDPCANSISLLLFCAEVLYCSKIFFLFLNEHRVGCSWCQPYRRYFFCIYMCISLFYERYIWLYLASTTLPVFLLVLASLGSRCIRQTPFHMVGFLNQHRSLVRSLHLYLYLHLYLQIL